MTPTATGSGPAPPPARLRLFVAIALPDAWRRYLARREQAIERLAPGYARWVAPELLHLTLVFLGELPPRRLPAIREAIGEAAAGQPTFPLALGRLGYFGRPTPRVLWIEAQAPGRQLDTLHAALCAGLAARGVPFEEKPLVPHLTLGRARRDATPAAGRALTGQLPGLPTTPVPPLFSVGAISLMRSELSPSGPRYTALGDYPLG